MPLVNGLEVVAELRKNTRFDKSVVAVISTGMSERDSSAFTALGANHVHIKPYQLKEYRLLVEKIMQ